MLKSIVPGSTVAPKVTVPAVEPLKMATLLSEPSDQNVKGEFEFGEFQTRLESFHVPLDPFQ